MLKAMAINGNGAQQIWGESRLTEVIFFIVTKRFDIIGSAVIIISSVC